MNEYGHCLKPLAGVTKGFRNSKCHLHGGRRVCDIKFARLGLALSSCGWSPSRRTNTFSRPACIKIADLRHHPGTSQPEGRNGCGSRDLANTGIVVDSWYRGAGAGYTRLRLTYKRHSFEASNCDSSLLLVEFLTLSRLCDRPRTLGKS